MDNGEAEVSDHVLFPNVDSSSNLEGSTSVDSFFGEFLRNTSTCTHTHTCNPPGPDAAHTHTCYHNHTHTQMFSSEDDEKRNGKKRFSKVRRPSGNREAVRKYREKKKAHTAYLEEEVQKLRALNQQLARKLQGQALLEAEVIRLKSLLVDLRGKIEIELGAIPFQKPCNSTSIKEGDFRVQYDTMVLWAGKNCQPAIGDCHVKANEVMNSDEHNSNTVETIVSMPLKSNNSRS